MLRIIPTELEERSTHDRDIVTASIEQEGHPYSITGLTGEEVRTAHTCVAEMSQGNDYCLKGTSLQHSKSKRDIPTALHECYTLAPK
jgi:hypothetical protein